MLTADRIAYRIETTDGRLVGACPTPGRARRFAMARALERPGAEYVIVDQAGAETERLCAVSPLQHACRGIQS